MWRTIKWTSLAFSPPTITAHRRDNYRRKKSKLAPLLGGVDSGQLISTNSCERVWERGRLSNLMKRCQSVYVGVVDVSSLPEQRRHLLPIPGRASGHKHGSLREANFRPSRPRNTQRIPGLRSRPIRFRTQPSLQLILPSLLGSFGPGMVSSRHLPWSDSAHGTRRSGVDALD